MPDVRAAETPQTWGFSLPAILRLECPDYIGKVASSPDKSERLPAEAQHRNRQE